MHIAVADPIRRSIVVAVLAVGLAISTAWAQQPKPTEAGRVGRAWTGNVVVIADGDTLEVMRDGKAVRVRLAGIDAPEWGQPWNRRARTRLGELVFRRNVDVTVRDVDRYGRDVVDVRLADGRRVNDVLVAEGLAWFYAAYSTDAELGRLEAEARLARRGLWSDRKPTAPWVWRKLHPRTSR